MPANLQRWKMRKSAPAEPSLRFLPPKSIYAVRAGALMPRLPRLSGRPIRLFRAAGLRDGPHPVHAGSFLRERSIAFNCSPDEFPRVCVHEIFHFVWWRLGNSRRHSYEGVVREEIHAHARGELGWSAEWRKNVLTTRDFAERTRAWRQYCCESFCDTAAALFSDVREHAEFTLARTFRNRRRAWFAGIAGAGPLPV
jgi:hypothetical protein